ncbi:S8 family peptidase, partial [Bacteroidales bacterium OttesenSCG-928-M06]|nr:S8 family peptidase [Bacteroidales bacterium OttesenSCG-928-M06]
EKRIKDTDKNIVGISVVEEALDFSPVIDLENNEEEDLKVKLINYGDYKLNEIAQRSFENLCNSMGLKYTKLNYTKDLILYRVSSVKPQSLINANESESIFSITKVPVVRLTKSSLIEEDEIKVKSPEEGVDYFKIGVFDEGISDISHLKEWKDGSYIAFGKDEYNNDHGTFVAGIINYGDQLEGKDWTGTKPFKITEAVIYPNDKFGYIDEPMMVDFMREAVKRHPEVKVWNFSIGNDTPVQDSKYSDFACYLDELQEEYNILIVKAAGNCSNFMKSAPRGRITEASESVKTLVVGSLAHDKRDHDLTPKNYPSPFSMVGPGCGDVIKPDLVHYGGNVGFKEGRLDLNGVKSFSADGKICSSVGTSYSTPRVAALAAELAGSMKEEFNSDFIKALLIHSAKHPEEFDADLMDRINQIGFGLPSKVADILYNDPDEVTLILMDAVDKGSNIKIMDFPFPKSLVEDGYFYGQVKITLVSSPEINSYHGAEYVQSDVDASFGTYEKKVEIKDSKVKRNPIDMEDKQNLLVPSLYSTRKQKSATATFKSERFLHSYSSGHTELFMPVKKWCIDLEELREAPKKANLYEDRLWFLQLEASYRNDYDLRMKDSKNISQEFVMIITIKDPKKKGTVYDEVTNLLTQYNFIHENIKVDERVIIK